MRSRIFEFCLLAVLCAPSASWADIQGPSLERGAIIKIEGGMPSAREVRRYKHKHGRPPKPWPLRLVVREVQALGGCEYYLDGCGMKPVTLNSNPVVSYLGYYAADSGVVSLMFNVERQIDGKSETYCFCYRKATNEAVLRGAGVPAEIRIDKRDGNTYYGRINGVLFHPGKDDEMVFQWAPIMITVPAPGESLPWTEVEPPPDSSTEGSDAQSSAADVGVSPDSEPTKDSGERPPVAADGGASSESASASKEGEEPAALTEEQVQSIIAKRLAIIVQRPVNTALIEDLYAEQVYRLATGDFSPRERVVQMTSRIVERWDQRSVDFLEAGYTGSHLEIIIQYHFSREGGKTDDSFCKIVLEFNSDGKICAMSETFSEDTKPELSEGLERLDYRGEKTVVGHNE